MSSVKAVSDRVVSIISKTRYKEISENLLRKSNSFDGSIDSKSVKASMKLPKLLAPLDYYLYHMVSKNLIKKMKSANGRDNILRVNI